MCTIEEDRGVGTVCLVRFRAGPVRMSHCARRRGEARRLEDRRGCGGIDRSALRVCVRCLVYMVHRRQVRKAWDGTGWAGIGFSVQGTVPR